MTSVVAVAAALLVGILAVSWFPTNTNATSTYTNNGPTDVVPTLLAGIMFSQNTTCSLETGTCTTTMVNNGTSSSYDVLVSNCKMDVITGSNGTITTYDSVNGTVAGPATSGVRAGTRIQGSCIVPTTELVHEIKGSVATGTFTVSLVNSLYAYPPGTEALVKFESTWS